MDRKRWPLYRFILNSTKAAYAGCGCHDNRMDKIWWNEQWMGYPVDSSYIACSNVENAHLLTRPLMLMVGDWTIM